MRACCLLEGLQAAVDLLEQFLRGLVTGHGPFTGEEIRCLFLNLEQPGVFVHEPLQQAATADFG